MTHTLIYTVLDDEPYKVYLKGVFDPIIVLPGHRLIVEVKRVPGPSDGPMLFETNVWREEEPVEGE